MMDPISIVVIFLLVLAIASCLAVGILYPFIQSKEGVQGPQGARGQQGVSLQPTVSSFAQQNVQNFNLFSSSVSQYANLVTLQAQGELKDLVVNATYMFAIIPSDIGFPLSSINGICFLDTSSSCPMTIASNGVITISPIPNAVTFNFLINYNI